jgi:hypothetical protein
MVISLPIRYRRSRNPRHRGGGRPVLIIVASVAGLAALALAVVVGFSGMLI